MSPDIDDDLQDPQTRAMLHVLAGLLVCPDESLSQQALGWLLTGAIPAVRRSAAAELVELLRDGDAGVCWRATAALAAVGPAAVIALVSSLLLGGAPAGQVRLAEALRALAPAVPPHRRGQVLALLGVVEGRESSKAVRAAVARARNAIRRHAAMSGG